MTARDRQTSSSAKPRLSGVHRMPVLNGNALMISAECLLFIKKSGLNQVADAAGIGVILQTVLQDGRIHDLDLGVTALLIDNAEHLLDVRYRQQEQDRDNADDNHHFQQRKAVSSFHFIFPFYNCARMDSGIISS